MEWIATRCRRTWMRGDGDSGRGGWERWRQWEDVGSGGMSGSGEALTVGAGKAMQGEDDEFGWGWNEAGGRAGGWCGRRRRPGRGGWRRRSRAVRGLLLLLRNNYTVFASLFYVVRRGFTGTLGCLERNWELSLDLT